MSQRIWSSINPTQTNGTMLAAILTDLKDALMTGLAGTTRPAQLQAGGMWIDVTQQNAPNYYWKFKIWTGVEDIEIFRLNINSGFGGSLVSEALFEVQQISADTSAAIMDLIKQRIEDNGEVLSGDTVAEIRFVGRTNTSTDTTVGYLKWSATDNMESVYGGTFSLFTTPDATSAITEHLKFIGGRCEVPVPMIVAALRGETQNIATMSAIAQLSADTWGVEFTGSTTTELQGVDSAGDSKEIFLHNRSTAPITLKHESESATDIDRFKLPGDRDYSLFSDCTITVFYCTTDSRWKIKDTNSSGINKTRETFIGVFNQWTAPEDVSKVTVYAHKKLTQGNKLASSYHLDQFGNIWAWGSNFFGQLGLGDVTHRSSPVAVLGGISFKQLAGATDTVTSSAGSPMGITSEGTAYAWGINNTGQLGLGDVTHRSSPVAVLGGLKWMKIIANNTWSIGITPSGSVYAWGANAHGQLGVGDVTSRSSPVAVLGGLKFANIETNDIGASPVSLGLTEDGVLYAWGGNDGGSLGVGDSISRSSPVAVLGDLVFKKVQAQLCQNTNGTHVHGLTPDGTLYSWGRNLRGELGLGDNTPRSSPVAVLGGLTFVDFSVSRSHVLALTATGQVYAWGQNISGELGDGSTTGRSSPVAVLGGLTFEKIWANTNCSYALTPDGSLYAWGVNTQGSLGVGDVTPRSSPVAVVGGIKFVEWIGGAAMSWAWDKNGKLYAWGNNPFSGDLGVGDQSNPRSSPVAVVGGLAFTYPMTLDQTTTFAVTPGATYDIKMGVNLCKFGENYIGTNLEKIVLEY